MKYLNSILIYGAAIPAAIAAAVLIPALMAYHSFAVTASTKHAEYEDYNRREQENIAMENKLSPHRMEIGYNRSVMDGDIQSELSTFLDQRIEGKLGSELTKQSIDFPPGISDVKGGWGSRTVNASFIGRYDALQALMMDCEAKFPQLKLAAFTANRLEPSPSAETPRVAYRATFKALTKPKSGAVSTKAPETL